MNLGVPGQILEIRGDVATVDFWGTQRLIRVDTLEGAASLGDYIVEYNGAAVRVIPIEDVADTLALYELLMTEDGDLCESRY